MRFYVIIGYFFTAVFGTLSHFLYDCSGKNLFISLVSPINESVWEHMKLTFFPILLYVFFLSCIRQAQREFRPLCDALLIGNLIGTLSIPVLFYIYSGILGHHLLIADILIFLISLLIAFLLAWRWKDAKWIARHRRWIYIFTLFFSLLFFLFTFYPPAIGLFSDMS